MFVVVFPPTTDPPHPARLKEVVYTLSNHHQNVMSGLWKDLPYKIEKKIRENWVDSLFLLIPVIGTYQCVAGGAAAARSARE